MQKRQSRGRLGEFLISAGHLTPDDLERALEIQRVAGGHLGTNLLEMGVLEEPVLLDCIGRLHESATVTGEQLKDIPREVSSKIPMELIRRHSIVPFALRGNTVYIASQRPGDIHIENEVTLATSRLTRTFIGLEVRVQEALHLHHGHSLPLRFSRLADRLDGKEAVDGDGSALSAAEVPAVKSSGWVDKAAGGETRLKNSVSKPIDWERLGLGAGAEATANSEDSSKAEPIPGASSDSETPSTVGARALATLEVTEIDAKIDTAVQKDVGAVPTNEIPVKEARKISDSLQPSGSHFLPSATAAQKARHSDMRLPRLEVPSAADGAVSEDVPSDEFTAISAEDSTQSRLLLDAHAALLEATNRDAVARIVMEALRPFFSRRLLLAKRGEQLRGWLADGPGIRPMNLLSLSFPIASGTPFLSIQTGSRFWLGTYHQDQAYELIEGILGPLRPPDCMVLPLRAGDHIVGFLYGDNERSTVTGQPLAEFLALTEAAGAAFERIIRRIRQNRNLPKIHLEPEVEQDLDPWSAIR